MTTTLVKHSLSILEKAKELGVRRLAVKVSGGKDSTCLVDMVHRSGIESVYIHQYMVPGLRLDEEVLEALESRFDINILRVAHPQRSNMLNSDTLCINKVWESEINSLSKVAMDRFIAAVSKSPWIATGIKKTDSITRAMALTKHPNPNPNNHRVYPLHEWKDADVWSHIAENDLPVSRCYKLIKRSLDVFNVKHLYPLKAGAPDDFERICRDFPLVESICWLYEKRAREYGMTNLPEC